MATRFRALAAPVDASTGDRRRFADGALTHQPLPMPARWQREDAGGHDYAVSIGSIDGVEMDGDQIWVTGSWFDDAGEKGLTRLAADVAEAMYLADQGVLGFSVDLDDFDAVPVKVGTDDPIEMADLDDPDLEVEMLVTKGRIRSATMVAIPAYVETNHTIQSTAGDEPDDAVSEPDDPADTDPELALVASVSGSTDLPVGDRDAAWDGPAAAGRIFDEYSDEDGNVDKAKASRAFLWVDGDGTKRGDYKLGFADLVGGELKTIPRGVAATAGGRGVDSTDLADSDKTAIKSRVCSLYAHVRDTYDDWPACPFDDGDKPAESSALTASMGPAPVPATVFTAPVPITGPTPITFDLAANPPVAYGHIALWATCHEGFADSCVLAPRDPGEGKYREFHVHRVETDKGTVYAGRITAGGVHPSSTDFTIGAHAVRQHHDKMTTVANVVATEDEFGLFVCGPMFPNLDDRTLRILSRRKVSPDWRETVDGLSMVEVLALKPGPRAVSEPGFPIKFSFHNGRQVALTAALGPEAKTAFERLDFNGAVREAVAAVRADDERRAAEFAAAQLAREALAATMSKDADRLRTILVQTMGA